MISGNYSHSEVRWQGALISLLSKQFWEALLGAPAVTATGWRGTMVHSLDKWPHICMMGAAETYMRRHMGRRCWSTAWNIAWIQHLLIEKDKTTDTYVESSSKIGCKLYCIYNGRATLGKDQTEPETGTTHPSMPSATHGWKMASWKILKGIVTSTTSTISSLCTLPTHNPSRHWLPAQ